MESGPATLSVSAPDSITTWYISAFVTSQQDVSVVSPVELRVFQDFFVDVQLPHEAVRREELPLVVTVFSYAENYESLEATVTVQLEGCALLDGSLVNVVHVQRGEGKKVRLRVVPTTLGNLRIPGYPLRILA